MTRAAAIFAGLAAIASSSVGAQQLHTPMTGSFEQYLSRVSPGLIAKSPNIFPKPMESSTEVAGPKGSSVVPPKSPFPSMEQLPSDDSRTLEYVDKKSIFLDKLLQLQQLQSQYEAAVAATKRLNFLQPTLDLQATQYLAAKIVKWNGDIFWAPASKETDINLKYGDEVRAVFGPIPPFDVTVIGRQTRPDGWTVDTGALFVEVDGNRVELKPNTAKPGNPLEFEHRDVDGIVVKRTTTVDKCDKPSLAGGVTPCGTASRVSRSVKGNVEWIALARKTKGVEPLKAEPYWTQEDPSYELLGYIGFNRESGELAFFDGSYQGMRFTWESPVVPPGGSGYQDEAGRTIAARTYDSTFRIDCAACHDDKEPRIITPYIKQSRVGYRSPERAKAFSLGDLLPELTRGPKTPYRVIGTSYTALHSDIINGARVINDPTRNCTSCHGLTNNGTGRFGSDAVGKLGTLTGDEGAENGYRTAWALRDSNGKIHPWMAPRTGGDLSDDPPPPPLSDTDWERLRKVIEDPTLDPRAFKLYTDAPAPESVLTDSTRIADPSGPTNLTIRLVDNRDNDNATLPKEVQVLWTYLNTLGGVSARDDVRFHVSIKETDIPQTGGQSQLSDFPSVEETKGIGAAPLAQGVFTDGREIIIKDLSFAGHIRWTDPSPSVTARLYQLNFPASANKRYLIRVVAKRFTFDQSGEVYSGVDHVVAVDTKDTN